MNEQQKEELLVRLDERVARIDKWCNNHDVHHFRYTLMAWGVALGAIVTLAVTLIKLL